MKILLLFVTLLMTASIPAQETLFGQQKALAKFWVKLYVQGGNSLYCDEAFEAEQRIEVDAIYPVKWILSHANCKDINFCRSLLFQYASADLHNLWPVMRIIPNTRNQLPFGEIPGENDRHFTDRCEDFERSGGARAVIEPRDSVKGDIARSLLYMSNTYDMPLHNMGPMLLRWHKNDPVDDEERRRNNKIENIQGTRNPFIDGIDSR